MVELISPILSDSVRGMWDLCALRKVMTIDTQQDHIVHQSRCNSPGVCGTELKSNELLYSQMLLNQFVSISNVSELIYEI